MTEGLGAFVHERRTRLGFTQERVALAAGISRSHLSQIESGKIALPNAETRRLLASALAVEHVELLIAAGELTAEEMAARRSVADGLLDELVRQMDVEAKEVLILVAQQLARRTGAT